MRTSIEVGWRFCEPTHPPEWFGTSTKEVTAMDAMQMFHMFMMCLHGMGILPPMQMMPMH